MKTLKIVLAMSLVAAANVTAQNQPPHQRHDINTVLSNNRDTTGVYDTFSENAPSLYHIPGAPRFAIIGDEHKFYLGIGGQARGVALYDWGNPITNPDEFTTSIIPMNQAKGNGGLYQMSGRQTGLFVNFVAMPNNSNKIGVFFAFNLMSGNSDYGFNVQYAYLKYRGFTVGYDYTLYGDMGAAVPTIDYEGPNSFTAFPNAVIDYRHTFGKLSLGAGLELPTASYTNSATTETVNQRVPDIPAYVQYSWTKGSWLRFSALMRNMAYRNVVADKNENATGWSVKLSGTAAITPSLRAYWQGAYGNGMTSYFQDLFDGGLDLTPSAKPGKLNMVKSWGGYAGLQYTFSPKVYADVAYSHVRTYTDKYDYSAAPWGGQYKYAQYAVANVFYNISSIVSWGVEYLWGRRVDFDGVSRHDNRIQTMIQVSF